MNRTWLRGIIRFLIGRDSDEIVFVFVGIVIGLAIGVLEAFLAASREGFQRERVNLYFSQFGFACPFFGGIIGYIVAKKRLQEPSHKEERITVLNAIMTSRATHPASARNAEKGFERRTENEFVRIDHEAAVLDSDLPDLSAAADWQRWDVDQELLANGLACPRERRHCGRSATCRPCEFIFWTD